MTPFFCQLVNLSTPILWHIGKGWVLVCPQSLSQTHPLAIFSETENFWPCKRPGHNTNWGTLGAPPTKKNWLLNGILAFVKSRERTQNGFLVITDFHYCISPIDNSRVFQDLTIWNPLKWLEPHALSSLAIVAEIIMPIRQRRNVSGRTEFMHDIWCISSKGQIHLSSCHQAAALLRRPPIQITSNKCECCSAHSNSFIFKHIMEMYN